MRLVCKHLFEQNDQLLLPILTAYWYNSLSVIIHLFCKESNKVAEECIMELLVSVLSALKVVQPQ